MCSKGSLTRQSKRNLADTIVAAVFMGLVRERLTKGYQVFIGYGGGFDAYEGARSRAKKDPSGPEADLHTELLESSRTSLWLQRPAGHWGGQQMGGCVEGRRENASTSSYVITGAMSDKQVRRDVEEAKQLALDCLATATRRWGR